MELNVRYSKSGLFDDFHEGKIDIDDNTTYKIILYKKRILTLSNVMNTAGDVAPVAAEYAAKMAFVVGKGMVVASIKGGSMHPSVGDKEIMRLHALL